MAEAKKTKRRKGAAPQGPGAEATLKQVGRKAAAKPRQRARLRPGQLDGLVLGQMRRKRAMAPHTAGAIAGGIGRSAGAVANCLARLQETGKVRLVKKSPRAYELAQRGE